MVGVVGLSRLLTRLWASDLVSVSISRSCRTKGLSVLDTGEGWPFPGLPDWEMSSSFAEWLAEQGWLGPSIGV